MFPPTASEHLIRYATWFLTDREWMYGIPQEGHVIAAHASVTTIILHRSDQFQTELVIMHPGSPEWPGEHCHPNVESIEGALYDCKGVTRNGEIVTVPDHKIGNVYLVHLAPTDYHRSPSKPFGSALLSFQMWLNNIPPTSVGLDWHGAPVHPSHAAQHAALGNSAK